MSHHATMIVCTDGVQVPRKSVSDGMQCQLRLAETHTVGEPRCSTTVERSMLSQPCNARGSFKSTAWGCSPRERGQQR